MIPSPTERDERFKRFARALFKGDMDALYQVVTPDFLWSFHDGLAVTKSLQGPRHPRAPWPAEGAVFDVAFSTRTARHRTLHVQGRQARDQGCLPQATLILGNCSNGTS
jgi:hypothetical protein